MAKLKNVLLNAKKHKENVYGYHWRLHKLHPNLMLFIQFIITFLFVVGFSKFKVCQKAYDEENIAIKFLGSALIN